ncbi:S41 family peptidase [Clostridium polynesiense]|uniref:S41 family peptidase n=1 Tax=Clostridium polynesiense TaxID=1325933 RepID=UPI0009E5C22F
MSYMNGFEPQEDRKRKGGRGKWIALTVVLVLFTALGSFYLGTVAAFSLPGIAGVSGYKGLEDIKDVEKFNKLFQIREALYKWYDGPIDDNLLVEGAIKGMTSSLNDPYTVFMNQEEFRDFSEKNEGEYVGLGIQVGVKDDKITVISPFEGSPADKVGILPGDVILKVNGIDVTGKEIDKAVSMMKGNEKVEVKLTMFRESKGSFDVSVKRDTINMTTVKSEMLNNNIGYISISMFDEHTTENFNKKLKDLKSKGMKGLILDLRDNPGGLLSSSVEIASNFIPKDKVIVSTIDKYKKEQRLNSEGGIAQGLPLVVLINEYTASASEIVSGAIRDYDAGELVGTKTFGKGVVQSVVSGSDGTALKVTISKYYTPKGENIHQKGISPDIEVKYPDELREKVYKRSEDPQFNKALEVIKEKIK